MTFSSDGRFFAYSTIVSSVYLWKESPIGYILHGVLAPGVSGSGPLLSRNGESIATFGGCAIRLWRTKGFTAPPSSTSAQPYPLVREFVLDFSHDGMLAVFARNSDKIVTVLNLKSGVPQLTIDASIGVNGFGMIGNTVVVMGGWKTITWDLPAGDFVPDARVGLKESSRTITHGGRYQLDYVHGASISPDFQHVAFTAQNFTHANSDPENCLRIYDVPTGEDLQWRLPKECVPRFSPDGHNIWCANSRGEAKVWRVVGGQEVLECLEQTVNIEDPSEGSPWGSSFGYRVTEDWWILGPDGRRLLMLLLSRWSIILYTTWILYSLPEGGLVGT